jgi:hypothetical protein
VQSFQPLHAVAMQGLVVIAAMNREQSAIPMPSDFRRIGATVDKHKRCSIGPKVYEIDAIRVRAIFIDQRHVAGPCILAGWPSMIPFGLAAGLFINTDKAIDQIGSRRSAVDVYP